MIWNIYLFKYNLLNKIYIMGNTNRVIDNTSNHSKFNSIKIKERFNKKEQMIVTKNIPSRIRLEDWQQEYKQLSDIKKENLLLPEKYTSKSTQEICCGSNQLIELTFKYYQHLFHHEIQNRSFKNQLFSEQQLFYLLYNMVQSVKQFEIRASRFGDIRPKNILLNANGKMKMINRMSFPGQQTGFQKFINNVVDDGRFFLAPEEIRAIKNPEIYQSLQYGKAQAFSVGLTILQAASLEQSEKLYNNVQILDESLLGKKIEKIAKQYSKYFISIIESLLVFDETKRLTCGQMWATLKPFQKQINEVKEFKENTVKSQEELKKYRQKKRLTKTK